MPIRLLILLALGSPLVSALLLRYLRTRLTAVPFYSIGTVLFGVAGVAALLLAQANVERVQVGQLILVQPQGVDLAHDHEGEGEDAHADEQPTLAPTPIQVGATPTAPTATATASPTRAATATATATATPTASPTATATPTPTSAPPTATPAPAVRRYTVQDGDTLRSIAEDFGVTVQQIINANGFSADDADSIQPGDTLIIP